MEDAADGPHVVGVVEWQFGEVLLDARFKLASNLAVSGRAEGRDVVVDGMLRSYIDVVPLMKTAGVVENSRHCIYSIGLKCF